MGFKQRYQNLRIYVQCGRLEMFGLRSGPIVIPQEMTDSIGRKQLRFLCRLLNECSHKRNINLSTTRSTKLHLPASCYGLSVCCPKLLHEMNHDSVTIPSSNIRYLQRVVASNFFYWKTRFDTVLNTKTTIYKNSSGSPLSRSCWVAKLLVLSKLILLMCLKRVVLNISNLTTNTVITALVISLSSSSFI